jgi:catechol-2,3-dioxygenase
METRVDQLVAACEAVKLTRRQVLSALALTGTSVATRLTGRPVSAQTGASVLRARTINHVSMAVSDLPRSAAFYQSVFGLPALRNAR